VLRVREAAAAAARGGGGGGGRLMPVSSTAPRTSTKCRSPSRAMPPPAMSGGVLFALGSAAGSISGRASLPSPSRRACDGG
jgi:hypothetical protein